jgi:hypothetical protein
MLPILAALLFLACSAPAAPQDVVAAAPTELQALTQQGWSRFPVAADARIVYLSSEGKDTDDGLSAEGAKQSPAAAYALLRHGYPDRLRIRRGDKFHTGFGQWKKSGRSAAEPMVVETYGKGERPLFLTGTSTFLFTSSGGGSPASIDFLALLDIEATAQSYTGTGSPVGVSFSSPSTSITVEGCKFYNYEVGIVFTSGRPTGHRDLRVRRNDCSHNFATLGTVGHGIYVAGARGLWRIEENVSTNNGLHPQSVFRHGYYMPEGSEGTYGVLRNNISANNSANGYNLRSGGKIHGNLSLGDSVSFFVGGWNGAQEAAYAPDVQWNVALDGKDIAGTGGRGHAITMGRWVGGKFKNNIFAHQTKGTAPICWTVTPHRFSGVEISDNVWYRWEGGSTLQATADMLAGTSLRNCSWDLFGFEGVALGWDGGSSAAQAVPQSANRIFRARGNDRPIYCSGGKTINAYAMLVGDGAFRGAPNEYPSPERTIETYMQEVLEVPDGDLEDFVSGARSNRKGNWNEAYTARAVTAYIQAGFGKARR